MFITLIQQNQIKSYLKIFHLRYIQGQQLSFVGYSGSGKNTIIQLLTRFYDVEDDKEEILIIVMLHVIIKEKIKDISILVEYK